MALIKTDARSATALDATILTGNLPAISGASLPGISAGITEYDQWRLTTSFTGNAYPISSNLERNDSSGFEKIGTGMSNSSGTFTFPSTGKWEIHFNLSSEANTQNADNFTIGILTTINNSDYTERSVAQIGQTSEGASGFRNGSVINFFDCTDTSTHKVKFFVNDISGSQVSVSGNTDKNLTYMTFKKIGNT